MELFHIDGHLTDEGLSALVQDGLDELSSLEAAEHLSFCDACLDRYTTLLTGDVLVAPEQPLREPVLKRIRRGAVRIGFKRYASVAAAAVLAVALWSAGAIGPVGLVGGTRTPKQPESSQSTGLAARVDGAIGSVTGTIGDFFQDLFQPAPTSKNPILAEPENDTGDPAQQESIWQDRASRESLFERDDPFNT